MKPSRKARLSSTLHRLRRPAHLLRPHCPPLPHLLGGVAGQEAAGVEVDAGHGGDADDLYGDGDEDEQQIPGVFGDALLGNGVIEDGANAVLLQVPARADAARNQLLRPTQRPRRQDYLAIPAAAQHSTTPTVEQSRAHPV